MTKQNISIKKLLESDFEEIKSNISFEQGLELLDDLVAKVESGELPLDTAITAYTKGASLLTHLKDLLGDAEQKLEMIKVN